MGAVEIAHRKEGRGGMKDERRFKEVIHTIKGAEKDKDTFCKAARIERQPMSDDRLKFVCYFIAGLIAEILGIVLLFVIVLCMAGVL